MADTFLSRARGMLFRDPLPAALILVPCTSVHGAWMREPLDVALLDRDGVVLHMQVLRPWGFVRSRRGAYATLEAPVGSFARWGLTDGDRVIWR